MITAADNIPVDLEAEKVLVSACLLEGKEAVEEIQLAAPNSDSLFWDIRMAELWRRAEKLAREGKRVSLEAIASSRVTLDIPRSAINELELNALPLSCLKSFLPGAIEARKRREAIFALQTALADSQDMTRTSDTVIDQAEQSLFNIRFQAEADGTIKDSLAEAVSDWEAAHQQQGKHTGVDSGFMDLDYLTWGFQPRNLIVFGARPSQGKTAMLCNVAEHACVENGIPTLIFSLEMTRKELLKRMVCSMARVNSSDMRAGQWTERDFPKVMNAMSRINKSPLTIIDRGTLSINAMRTIARRHVSKHGVKLILVDYLQKVRSTGRHEKRTYEVGEVSTGLKEMAKECNCPVVCAAQLNRESEKEKERAPKSSDLGDSGMIERDADLIGLLWRGESEGSTTSFKLILSKHRDGPCGTVNLTFIRYCTRFESSCRLEDEATAGTPYKD